MKIYIKPSYMIFESDDLQELMAEVEKGNWRMKELNRGRESNLYRMKVVSKRKYEYNKKR